MSISETIKLIGAFMLLGGCAPSPGPADADPDTPPPVDTSSGETERSDRDLEPQGGGPEWAHGATWYQIFPERFANGNPANDPSDVSIHMPEWLSDFARVSDEELELAWARAAGAGFGHDPETPGGALYEVVFHRRFGGDLQGVLERLDHLADLGVTGLYLTPVFHAQSLHKYDATDHRHIDPAFGHPGTPGSWLPDPSETGDPATWSWTPADRFFIDVFLPEAKRRGFRVIMDGVWNHVGREHWAFRDVVERGAASAYGDWFDVRFSEPNAATGDSGGRLIGWNAWDRPNGWLPVFRQTPARDLTPPVKEHVFEVTRRWMDPNGDGDPSDGIDGWRLDVAPEIGLAFWNDWADHVRSINPQAIIIGEFWFRADDYFEAGAFDAQMNYPFAFGVVNWLRGDADAEACRRQLEYAFKLPHRVNLAQFNLLDSHDTERIASMLFNPGRGYDSAGSVHHGNPDYLAHRPPDRIFDLVCLGAAFQATYLGSPMIYYGDELGMYGGDDPDNRRPMVWPDRGDPGNPDEYASERVLEKYRHWLSLRRDPEIGKLLRFGTVRHVDTTDPDLFAFERRASEERILVLLNRSDAPIDFTDLAHTLGYEAASGSVVESRDARIITRRRARPD